MTRKSKDEKIADTRAAHEETRRKAAANRTATLQHLYTWLQFWTVCPDRRCKRVQGCRGDIDVCRGRWWPHVPEEIKVWLQAALSARAKGASTPDACRAGQEAEARWQQQEAYFAEQRAAVPAEASPRAMPDAPSAPSAPRVRAM